MIFFIWVSLYKNPGFLVACYIKNDYQIYECQRNNVSIQFQVNHYFNMPNSFDLPKSQTLKKGWWWVVDVIGKECHS